MVPPSFDTSNSILVFVGTNPTNAATVMSLIERVRDTVLLVTTDEEDVTSL